MFTVGPTFFSSPGAVGPQNITNGSPTSAGGPTSFAVKAAPIDSTRVLVVYQDASTFKARAVIATDAGGGVVSWGTPVDVSPGTGAMRTLDVLDSSAGLYAVCYMPVNQVHTRIIEVSGSSINIVGTDDTVISSAGISEGEMCVISPTIIAVVWQDGSGVWSKTGTVSSYTTTYTSAALTEMGDAPMGQGSRLMPCPVGVAMYGSKFGVADGNLWACSVSSANANVPAYLPAFGSRVQTHTGNIAGPTAHCGGGVHALIAKVTSTEIYCTRAQFSGGVATYSNNDSSPNLLNSGPYTAPDNDAVGGALVCAPSGSKLLHMWRGTGIWKGGLMTVAGNINMAGNSSALTPAATTFAPDAAFLTEHKAIMVWGATSNILTGQVLAV